MRINFLLTQCLKLNRASLKRIYMESLGIIRKTYSGLDCYVRLQGSTWAEHSSSSGPSAPGQLVGRVPLEGSSSRANRGIKTRTDIYSISKGSCHRNKRKLKKGINWVLFSVCWELFEFTQKLRAFVQPAAVWSFFYLSILHSWRFCLMAML